jgi:uncharacterized protein YceH (UPF0502 family)
MQLNVQLDPTEARLFGVLIEKAMTTPDQYPLTIHAATTGANQKSNRDPVLALSEDEVAVALQHLERKYLVRTVFPMNSRVEKFCHNGKDALALNPAELAVMAELLMRGPQTPGDLRARASRMADIESLDQLLAVLGPLIERGFVRRLPPVPGSRAERYAQLMCPDLHPLDAPPAAAPLERTVAPQPDSGLVERLAAVETEVVRLRRQLQRLAERIGTNLDAD